MRTQNPISGQSPTIPRGRTLVITAMMLLAPLALLLVATPTAATVQSIRFVEPDVYSGAAYKPIPDLDGDGKGEVYGSGALAYIFLEDDAIGAPGTDTSRTVTVVSNVDATGETITLHRVPARNPSGSEGFLGVVGFETTKVAGNGRVAVQDKSPVTVSVGGSSKTDQVIWHTGTTGVVTLDKSIYQGVSSSGLVPAAVLRVVDNDRNVDLEAKDTITVDVQSTSQLKIAPNFKNTFTLTETGENTGVFETVFTFENENGMTDMDDKVDVADGDTILVTYEDPHDATGKEVTRTTKAVWHAANTAVVYLLDADFTAIGDATGVDGFQSYFGTGDDVAGIRVYDLDRAGEGTVQARVYSDTDMVGLTLTLKETGAATGEFIGTFGFSTTSTGNGRLAVATDDDVKAVYKDPLQGDGSSGNVFAQEVCWGGTGCPANGGGGGGSGATVSATITILSDGDADLPVTPADILRGVGGQTTMGVQVKDNDGFANSDPAVKDEVLVRLSSTLDPLGVDVTLQETGPDTGVFVGRFVLNTGMSIPESLPASCKGVLIGGPIAPDTDCANLWVSDGDIVTATYIDPSTGSGAKDVATTDTAPWLRATTGQVIFGGGINGDEYYGESQGVINRGVVYVYDPDASSIDLSITSTNTGDSIRPSLSPVGSNSGLWAASFGFSKTAGNNVDILKVSGTDTLTGTYADAFDATAAPATQTASATWKDVPACPGPRVNAGTLNLYGTGSISVYLYAEDTVDVADDQTIEVTIEADDGGGGAAEDTETIEFTETADGSGVWTAAITIEAAAFDDDDGNVQVGTAGTPVTLTFTVNAVAGEQSGCGSSLEVLTWKGDTENVLPRYSTATGGSDVTEAFGTQDPVYITNADASTGDGQPAATPWDFYVDTATVQIQGGAETLTKTLVEVDDYSATPLVHVGGSGVTTPGALWGEVGFEPTLVANNGKIRVTDDGQAKLSRSGSTTTLDSLVWHPLGTVIFRNSAFTGTVSAVSGSTATPATVYVEIHDAKVDASPTTADRLQAWLGTKDNVAGPDGVGDEVNWDGTGATFTGGVTFTLVETGANTGIFQGTVSVSSLPGGVMDGELLTIQYSHFQNDLDSVSGNDDTADDGVVYATIPFVENDPEAHEMLFVTDPRGDPTVMDATSFAGINDVAYLRIVDGDSMTDINETANTVNVRVFSTSDPIGFEVPAKELWGRPSLWNYDGRTPAGANPGANPGAITLDIHFSRDTTNAGTHTIQVADGDAVQAEYVDPFFGSQQNVLRSAGFFWNEATTASLAWEDDMDQFAEETSTATIIVTDNDQNTNNVAVDTVTVKVFSLDSTGAAVQDPETITLNETGSNTGIFSGTFEFSLACPAPTDLTDGCLMVVDASDLVVSYTDTNDEFGNTVVRTITGRWYETSALNLDDVEYNTYEDTAMVTLQSKILDNSAVTDFINNVWVFSQSDPVGVRLNLAETGTHTGVFTASFGFESSQVPGNDKLFVNNGDEVTVYFLDKNAQDSGSVSPARLDRAVWFLEENQPPVAALSLDVSSGFSPLDVAITMSGVDLDGDIVSYTLDLDDGTVFGGTWPPDVATISHTFTNNGDLPITYHVTLSLTDDHGNVGSVEASVLVDVEDTVPPDAIDDLVATKVTTNSVNLTWTAPGDNRGIDHYEVHFNSTSGQPLESTPAATNVLFFPSDLAAAGSIQSANVAGLQPETTYNITVLAVDAAGNVAPLSDPVVTITTKAPDRTPPTGTLAPTLDNPSNPVDGDPLTFTWTALEDPESTVSYHYILSENAQYVVGENDPSTQATAVTIEDVPAGTHYFHIRGISAGGSSPQETLPVTVSVPADVFTVSPAFINATNKALQPTVDAKHTADGNVVTWDTSKVPGNATGVVVWRIRSPAVWIAELPAGSPDFINGSYLDVDGMKGDRYVVTVFFDKTAGALGGYSTTKIQDLPGYEGLSDDEVTALASPGAGTNGGGFPWWWLLIALGVLVVAGLIVGAVVLLRKRGGKEEEWGDEGPLFDEAPDEDEPFEVDEDEPFDDGGEWPEGTEEGDEAAWPEESGSEPEYDTSGSFGEETAGPQVHYVTCPRCSHDFTAEGDKPLYIECPECSAKGLLK